MRSIGIEEARKNLGEIANRADLAGEITYLTRHGRAIAAVVPTLRPSHRDRKGADVITTQIPAHRTTTEQNLMVETWSCSCGATGVESDTETAGTLALAHQRAAARPVLRQMPTGELAQLLRAGAAGNWQRTAAIELLIEHDVWLHISEFRNYLLGSWTSDGTFELLIAWRNVAEEVGLYLDAINTLSRGGAPRKAIAALEEWEGDQVADLPTLDESSSENAVLRIAASIAADLPIKLFDDTSSLDNRNRGLVLTAIGHLLSHGGGVAFASATTWGE
jgi:antitoxin (DNA-binding transcriptional repressor) of toxin-antitoxin stability system